MNYTNIDIVKPIISIAFVIIVCTAIVGNIIYKSTEQRIEDGKACALSGYKYSLEYKGEVYCYSELGDKNNFHKLSEILDK